MNSILFNGLQYEPKGAGISRYAHKLMEAFIKAGYPIDCMMRKECAESYKSNQIIKIEKQLGSSTKRILEEQLWQSGRYKDYPIVHFPDYATPLLYRGCKIATIHDMVMHTMADKYTLQQRLTKQTLLQYTVRTANHLICDSEFTKKELFHYYPHLNAEVSVVYLGIDEPTYKVNRVKEQEVYKKHGIQGPYLLFVGTISPHKNIEKLIEAFAGIKRQGLPHQLVIAGRKGWMYEETFRKVEELGLKKQVVFTNFISDEELEVLYRGAALFVSPSLYEGFGFPPLEAMIRGCPVLVSDIEIFKETCKSHAVYCDPYSAEDMARKIQGILEQEAFKQELGEKGKTYARRFTWEETAKQTFEIYKQYTKLR